MRSGVEQVIAGKTGRNIVIVGHGAIFTITLQDLCGGVDMAQILSGENHNCSVSELTVALQGGRLDAELIRWASYEHLQGFAAELVPGSPDEHTAEARSRRT
jgi:broad specificity phosphatase PhoE